MRIAREHHHGMTGHGLSGGSRFEQAARTTGGQVEQVIVSLNSKGRDIPSSDIALRENLISLLQSPTHSSCAPLWIELQQLERKTKSEFISDQPRFEIIDWRFSNRSYRIGQRIGNVTTVDPVEYVGAVVAISLAQGIDDINRHPVGMLAFQLCS